MTYALDLKTIPDTSDAAIDDLPTCSSLRFRFR